VGEEMQTVVPVNVSGQGGRRLDAKELIRLGGEVREPEDLAKAWSMLDAAAATVADEVGILLEAATALRGVSRFVAAEGMYRRVLDRAPGHAGALIGLGKLAQYRGHPAVALMEFEAAAAADPRNVYVQVEIANTLRDMQRDQEAEARYRHVLDTAPHHIGAVVGLASLARRRADHAGALALLQAAAADHPGNVYVQVEIANTLRDLSRYEEAESRYRRVLDAAPDQLGALLGLASVARGRGDHAGALALYQAAAVRHPENQHIQLELGATFRDLQHPAGAEAIYRRILERTPRHAAALLGLGYIAREQSEWNVALEHFRAAADACPGQTRPLFEIASTLRELQRIEEAEQVLDSLEQCPGSDLNGELKERKFEHFCLTKQLDKAAECLAGWGHHRNVPSNCVPLAAGLYGARGQWQDVLDFFRERVVEGRWGGRRGRYLMLLEAVARAARHTGSYHVLLHLVDRMLAVVNCPELRDLRDQVTEELALLCSLGLEDGTDAPDPVIDSTLRTWRSKRLRQALGNSSTTEEARTIFWCTDSAFLVGAAVSIFSLMRHNLESLRQYAFIVFCSEEVLELTSGLCDRIATAFSTRISVRTAGDLVAGVSGLCTEYGMFTPGYALSEAAYYRIYATLQLQKEGISGRALYLDADTCVGPGVDRLIDFDMDGRPLGARLEVVSNPAIRRAAHKIGIAPHTYFNSGVLLFDLKHPALAPALREAMDTSFRHPDLLTFLDQCALNMAFQAKIAPLPQPFNTFVKQNTDLRTVPTDAVITHFLARPKPWDPMYATANCRRWIEELAALRQVVGAEWLGRLLALQFPRR
jgi:lipopolysaccharide biosynthesis glycosyltransferase/tetratricopeptide (TPR) repeat protein